MSAGVVSTPLRVRGRERILAAAVALLFDEGIEELRIARVAMAAGVSPALVHYHFDTREGLLAEALVRCFSVVTRGDVAEETGTARQQLTDKLDASLPSPGKRRRDWELWVELWQGAVRQPELRTTAASVYGRLTDSFVGLLADAAGREDRDAPDLSAAARRLLALIDGLGVRALLDDPAMPLSTVRQELGGALDAELHRLGGAPGAPA
jgi:AcrR family transcriptional regulator